MNGRRGWNIFYVLIQPGVILHAKQCVIAHYSLLSTLLTLNGIINRKPIETII